MKCEWDECEEDIEEDSKKHFLMHIEKLSVNKCLWKDCARIGEIQASKHALLAHARRHTGERPFECHICGKDYTRSDPLKKHLARHEAVESKNASLIAKIEYLSALLTEHRRETIRIMNQIESIQRNIQVVNSKIVDKIKENL
ncbi:hypothetical protein CWI42_070170 [Ordospora colligata]|uniref:C2H2-type domain-containing protein n=1 Tax=Ordospora colligata OC4 TaxID=1354746 RepID=A0A0B2UED2_9MICR|nr:uncharacterized protein M896_070170 [Ordospora colligata OC4]KHN69451.1 hypothetical protein M896_070170 [Ordospora colligata OC4]TBU15195.1 hypothetical protein CWI41_070170 [Ordospora colligata]TBU15266.1 hypothetical protein CWI40_070170 [Ordospora colligata]TBU18448.1 hypothetical protein CWI42_070170 [Ordospora colligata]